MARGLDEASGVGPDLTRLRLRAWALLQPQLLVSEGGQSCTEGVALGLDEASRVGLDLDLDSVAAAGMGAAAATAASAPKVVGGAHKVVNVVSSAVDLASANISKVN